MINNYLCVLQLLLRTSILLNLSLLLYLSLSAGWTVAGPGDAAAAPHPEPYSRGILNKYFGQCRVPTRHLSGLHVSFYAEKSASSEEVVTGTFSPSSSSSAASQPSLGSTFVSSFSLSENLTCQNKPLQFHQVGKPSEKKTLVYS